MATTSPSRPGSGEYLPYYGTYIDLAPDGDLLELMDRQISDSVALIHAIPVDRLNRRPEPAVWSPLDIAVHVADVERILSYRVLWIARDVGVEMPGFEPDVMAESAAANELSLHDAMEQFVTARRATLALMRTLKADDWLKRGVASGSEISVRALAYMMAGHVVFHEADFRKFADA